MQRRSIQFQQGKSASYLVGANYWASQRAHRMWEIWEPEQVESDLKLARQLGLNALRTFFWTPELSPFAGVVNEKVIERFLEFLSMAETYRLSIFPTLFVGHMSGTNWDIPWRAGRDFCADPYMVYWEAELVKKVVSSAKGHAAVAGWILTNELPNYTGEMSGEVASTWTRSMYYAVKEADPSALVSPGDGARCEVRQNYDGFRVEWVKDHVDWLGVHLYNYFNFDAGDNDELRKSYHISCRLRYVDVGKPVLLEEFGLSDLLSGSEEADGYFRSVLYSSWVNGSFGALAWSLTDFDLGNEVPYRFQPHELYFGIADSQRAVKSRGKVLGAFANFAERKQIGQYQMEPVHEAIFVPYILYCDRPHHNVDRLRYYRLLEEAFTLSKMAGLNPDFVRDVDALSEYDVVIMPGGRLEVPEWLEIEQWVRSGGTLYYSYAADSGGPLVPNFQTLTGTRHRIRYGHLDMPGHDPVDIHFESSLGGISSGREMSVPRGPLGKEASQLLVDPIEATVIANDGDGVPVLTSNHLGKGKVFFSTLPLEYMLMNHYGGNRQTRIHECYAAIASEAGRTPRFEGKPAPVEAVVLHASDKDSLLVLVNHSFERVEASMHDRVLNQTIVFTLESKGVLVNEHRDGKWFQADGIE